MQNKIKTSYIYKDWQTIDFIQHNNSLSFIFKIRYIKFVHKVYGNHLLSHFHECKILNKK